MAKQLHFLFADDDADDRDFFGLAFRSLPLSSRFTSVEDGEKLMYYLVNHADLLPDVLFLDLNMPRKNGAECLNEIKSNTSLQHLPVIIYSTSLHDDVVDLLYNNGAHYYIKKAGIAELEIALQTIATLMEINDLPRPSRDQFILNMIPA
ncbi:MAG: response regulator [Bacteroidota bacterium]